MSHGNLQSRMKSRRSSAHHWGWRMGPVLNTPWRDGRVSRQPDLSLVQVLPVTMAPSCLPRRMLGTGFCRAPSSCTRILLRINHPQTSQQPSCFLPPLPRPSHLETHCCSPSSNERRLRSKTLQCFYMCDLLESSLSLCTVAISIPFVRGEM